MRSRLGGARNAEPDRELLYDHLGSTNITTDAKGAVVSGLRYKARGEVRYPTNGLNPGPSKYTYTGQYSNVDDFGLMFYNARWYDPVTSRFTQPDTQVPSSQGVQAWDRYAYTNNNPLRYADPSGHGLCAAIQSLLGITLSCPSGSSSGALINVGVKDQGGPYINIGADPPSNNGWIIDPVEGQDLSPCICDPIEVLAGEIKGFDPIPDDDTLGVHAADEPNDPVEPYEVGTAADLKNRSESGDGLQIHHAPQGQPAGQVINGYDYPNAPAITLPDGEHYALNPTNLQGPYNGTPRDLLAKTIRDLRNYTGAPNSALRQLIELNMQMYPGDYAG
jgi:RHS repeat-associated protein